MEQMKIGCEQREFFYITYELQIFIYGDAFEQSECFVCMYSWHFSIYIITSRPLLESMDGWMENRFGIGEIYRITRMVNIVFNEIQNKLNGKCILAAANVTRTTRQWSYFECDTDIHSIRSHSSVW